MKTGLETLIWSILVIKYNYNLLTYIKLYLVTWKKLSLSFFQPPGVTSFAKMTEHFWGVRAAERQIRFSPYPNRIIESDYISWCQCSLIRENSHFFKIWGRSQKLAKFRSKLAKNGRKLPKFALYTHPNNEKYVLNN